MLPNKKNITMVTLMVLAAAAPVGAAESLGELKVFSAETGEFVPAGQGRHCRVEKESLAVYLDPTLPVWARTCFREGSSLWRRFAATPSTVFVDDEEEADVVVRAHYDDGPLPEGSTLGPHVVARTFLRLNETRSEIVGGTIYLNAARFEFVRSALMTSLRFGAPTRALQPLSSTFAHEWGHVLGFGHGPGQCQNIMEPTVSYRYRKALESCRTVLKAGPYDRAVARYVYGPRSR